MEKAKARRTFEKAREHVGDSLYTPPNFDEVDLEQFLRKYLWVIYVSGFRNAVVEKHFETIKASFHDLDLDKIAAMRSINADRLPIRHQQKADAFLRGCKEIHGKGWKTFKGKLKQNGMVALEVLPWMGPKTKKHLAKILGIGDTEVPDTWIKQCAGACDATVKQLFTFLSGEYRLTPGQVDSYLWRYCSDKQKLP